MGLLAMRALSVSLFLVIGSGPLHAADIVLGDELSLAEREMGCNVGLRGRISRGDSISIASVFGAMERPYRPYLTYGQRRLCLSSPGGSLQEAAAIARILISEGVSTAVPAGASCVSACSVVFLAGSTDAYTTGVREPSRHMHSTARVGFHAPSLEFEGDSFTRTEVNNAYALALESISSVFSVFGYGHPYYFPYLWLLETPSESMRYVETVEEALALHINISNASIPNHGTVLNLQVACENADLAYTYYNELNSFQPDSGRHRHYEEVMGRGDGLYAQPENPWAMWSDSVSGRGLGGDSLFYNSPTATDSHGGTHFSVPMMDNVGGFRGNPYSSCNLGLHSLEIFEATEARDVDLGYLWYVAPDIGDLRTRASTLYPVHFYEPNDIIKTMPGDGVNLTDFSRWLGEVFSHAEGLARVNQAGALVSPQSPSAALPVDPQPVNGQAPFPAAITYYVAGICGTNFSLAAPGTLSEGNFDGDGLTDYVIGWRDINCPNANVLDYCGASDCNIDAFLSSQGYVRNEVTVGQSVGVVPLTNGRDGVGTMLGGFPLLQTWDGTVWVDALDLWDR